MAIYKSMTSFYHDQRFASEWATKEARGDLVAETRGALATLAPTIGRLDKNGLERFANSIGAQSTNRPKPGTNSKAVLGDFLRAVEATRASSTKTPYQRMGHSIGKCLMGMAVRRQPSPISEPNQSRLQMVQTGINNFVED